MSETKVVWQHLEESGELGRMMTFVQSQLSKTDLVEWVRKEVKVWCGENRMALRNRNDFAIGNELVRCLLLRDSKETCLDLTPSDLSSQLQQAVKLYMERHDLDLCNW
ncbi:hypothetical protein Ciccas_003365 [Cichlidogyrus casuarinus]|uniref:Uncharacterized protein n=1 Tax=Cichlidogyrus casuarinus TaxID=1844966 RepID=A0ABD2QEK6_9PLAT